MGRDDRRGANIRALLRQQQDASRGSPHDSRGLAGGTDNQQVLPPGGVGTGADRGLTRQGTPQSMVNATRNGELRAKEQAATELRRRTEEEAYARKDRMEREVLIRRRARADRYGTKGGTLLTGPQGIVGNLGGAQSFLGA